jgi:hypothetical protein
LKYVCKLFMVFHSFLSIICVWTDPGAHMRCTWFLFGNQVWHTAEPRRPRWRTRGAHVAPIQLRRHRFKLHWRRFELLLPGDGGAPLPLLCRPPELYSPLLPRQRRVRRHGKRCVRPRRGAPQRRLPELSSPSSASLPLGRGFCIRGERGCNFASPLSCIGTLPRRLHPLLEEIPAMHSSQREAKILLPPAVGLSLRIKKVYILSVLRSARAAREGPMVGIWWIFYLLVVLML